MDGVPLLLLFDTVHCVLTLKVAQGPQEINVLQDELVIVLDDREESWFGIRSAPWILPCHALLACAHTPNPDRVVTFTVTMTVPLNPNPNLNPKLQPKPQPQPQPQPQP
jgi:hypothetical protein